MDEEYFTLGRNVKNSSVQDRWELGTGYHKKFG